MSTRNILATGALIVAGACGAGCTEKPDLVPANVAANSAFDKPGTIVCLSHPLTFVVRNVGLGDAKPTVTDVIFHIRDPQSDKSVQLDTPAIAAKADTTLSVDPPAGCQTPDCGFSIKVNAGKVGSSVTDVVVPPIDESDTTNNESGGSCVG